MSQETTARADNPVNAWISLQRDLGKAPNTVTAYGRGIVDFAAFCRAQGVDLLDVRKGNIAAYLSDLRAGSLPTTHRLPSNASLRHRLTIVRLFYDHLVEEGLRATNPVPRGRRGIFDGARHRGQRSLAPVHRVLPWIPSEAQWGAILEAARTEPIRNRLMLALAYDCALRREELCSLETSDIDPAHRLVTIRAETTKTKAGRVVSYSAVRGELLAIYFRHLHNPLYDFNDDSLIAGVAMWSRLVERYLQPSD